MNMECPNCKNEVNGSSMKAVRTDNLGRKAGKLGYFLICPYCEESLTRNKSKEELIQVFFIVFIPFLIGIIGYGYVIMIFIAVLFSLFSIVFALRQNKTTLKDWPRWVTITEFIERQESKE